MKQKEKSEFTREKIIDAAEALFARRGFDGTSIRQIVAEAGISIQTLHYHWENKINLYYRVLERSILPVMEMINRHVENLLHGKLADDDALFNALSVIIDDLFDIFSRHPNYPLLFFRQWLEQDRVMMRVEFENLMPILRQWAQIGESLNAGGPPSSGLDLRLLLINLSWIYTGLFVNSNFIGDLLGMKKDSPGYIDHLKKHAREVTIRMMGRAETYKPER